MAPLYYFIDGHLVAFKDGLNPAVRQVAYPAGNLMPRGYVSCVLPEIDALDSAAYKDMGASLFVAVAHLPVFACCCSFKKCSRRKMGVELR
jgi:hypothetical protein